MTKTLTIGQKTTSSSSKDTCPLRVERLQFEFTCSTSLKVGTFSRLDTLCNDFEKTLLKITK